MIGKLIGILDSSSPTDILINVNGICYEVIIPLSTFDKLPREGEKITLHTFFHVREDAQTLYGFYTKEEKDLYKILITASGIGPKLALKILSSISIDSFCDAISEGNIKFLSKINGLGKKTAERLLIELKDKILSFAPETAFGSKIDSGLTKQIDEATLALVQLGFKYDLARKTIKNIAEKLENEECNSENLIRLSLQLINS